MDLSKPDTLCVYCGTDREEVKIRINELEAENNEQKQRILSLILERDGYKIEADRKFGMRKELEVLLGWPERATNDEKEFKAATKRLRDIKSENKRLKKAIEWALGPGWAFGNEYGGSRFREELRRIYKGGK